jgi:glycosyltransferase involved in cell wall biosynthesis
MPHGSSKRRSRPGIGWGIACQLDAPSPAYPGRLPAATRRFGDALLVLSWRCMVLGVDAHRAAEARVGVGRTLEYVLRSGGARPLPFEEVRVFSPTPLSDLPVDGQLALDVLPARGPGVWWQLTRLRPRASATDALFAYYTLPPGFSGRSVVASLGIYEGEFALPGWRARARSWQYARSAHHADVVIAVARSTKADLVNFYGVPPEKIAVVWPGADRRFRPGEDDRDAIARATESLLGERAPFFLFVGKLSVRRNVPALLEAFARVAAERPQLRLLLVGPNSTQMDLQATLARLGIEGAVRHIEHLDQDLLALLYRGALAFVMPTTREGWSQTTLEALLSGCPVMVLKGASLGVLEYIDERSEAGREEVVLEATDPTSDALEEALRRLADDGDLRELLAKRGREVAAAFPTWDEHAGEVMNILEAVASRGR